jgi:alkylation response protein AidB-like acyl-CoA dehydrogenase
MLARSPDRVAKYLAAIGRLAPLIAEHRASFDEARRLPEVVFNALADAGLFRLWLPAALGGPELSPAEFMIVVEAVSALDGSVGWLVANGSAMSRVAGYVAEPVAREWLGNPRAFIVSSTGAVGGAQKVDGGYRVTGRWPFGSGSHHATRFMGLASTKGPDGRDEPPLCFYFERDSVEIHDTWRVSGLRGTGSCDFEVQDLFVPEQHAHAFIGPEPTQPGLLYRVPTLSIFPWAASVVPLGIARGAMDAFAELAVGKTRLGTNVALRDREIVQSNFGRMQALHRSGRAFMIETMSELIGELSADEVQLTNAKAIFRVACANAAENAVRIVDLITAEAGAASIFETCTIERYARDIHAAVKHVAMTPNSYVIAGRLGFGLDPNTTRL